MKWEIQSTQQKGNINVQQIRYLSRDHFVNGYLCCPTETGAFPVIIFNRGGSKDFGMIDEQTLERFLKEDEPLPNIALHGR